MQLPDVVGVAVTLDFSEALDAASSPYDVYSIADKPSWIRYQLDLKGFINGRFPDEGKVGQGIDVDLGRSTMTIEYGDATKPQFVPFSGYDNMPLATFRMTDGMQTSWPATAKGTQFRVRINAYPSFVKEAKPTELILKFDTSGMRAVSTAEASELLAAAMKKQPAAE